MNPFLIALITTAVPELVQFAENKWASSPGSGSQKHAYVKGAVDDLLGWAEKSSPDWARPIESAVGSLVDGLIESKLNEIDP